MLLAVGALFAFQVSIQVGEPSRRDRPAVVRDSTSDSTGRSYRRRLPVTAEVRATAFRDAQARDLFDRARAARVSQDSSLTAYDARVRARMSAGLSIGSR